MSSSENKSDQLAQNSIVVESEEDRLRRNIYLPDKEKYQMFVAMLRRNVMLKRAKVTHK